jgi:exosome complex RNA-binding protein Csl4
MNRRSLAVVLLFIILLIAAVYVVMNWPFSGVTHNVAVTDIIVSTATVQRGDSVNITVTSKNEGSVSESFNVSLYLNSSLLETRPVVALGSNDEKGVVFTWDTSTAPSADYLIKAEASPVAGETNVTDNALTRVVSVRSRPVGLAVVFVNPQNSSAAVGQDFVININVSNVADLYGWEFKLGWNNTILHLQNVTEGSFLKNTGATFFTYNLNSTGPHIVVDCTRLVDVPEANGNGTLSVVTFHVQQPGSCDLNLYDAVLINSFEQSMDCTTEGGHFIESA